MDHRVAAVSYTDPTTINDTGTQVAYKHLQDSDEIEFFITKYLYRSLSPSHHACEMCAKPTPFPGSRLTSPEEWFLQMRSKRFVS